MALFIGRDLKDDEDIYIEGDKSRSILICGKRGSGKSYTMGNIIEDIFEDIYSTQKKLVIIIDPMGIYHTMVEPNYSQNNVLNKWGFNPKSYNVKLLVAGDPIENYAFGEERILDKMKQRGVKFGSFKINPSDLSPDGWCDFFNLGMTDVQGICLFRAIQNLKRRMGKSFYLSDIINAVEMDAKVQDRTREALLNRLEWAESLNIFSQNYQKFLDIFETDHINIIDMKSLDPGRYNLRNLIVSILTKQLFKARLKARAMEELEIFTDIPKVWLAIDEAHQFAPSGKSTLAKEHLIRFVKEGRQPGLSLIVASQQPSAIDSEILSQCDLILCHKLTSKGDIHSINALSADYMGNELKTYIRKLGRVGEAVLVDDEKEKVGIVSIRPRRSNHGGGES
ncbi:MAG: ATP-binding protein [Candidatus Eremiobacteraeota bacterium]|nr:ATP-binding protein [Candidatus Eremiobacteraeota bacterium]